MPRFFMSPVNNKETQAIAKAMKKKLRQPDFPDFHPQIVYMEQLASIKYLKVKIQDGDTIEIHAEGLPWVIGSLNSDTYDYSPYKLAEYFDKVLGNRKEIQLTIELRACNSGTIATGSRGDICFAKNFSEALHYYGFHHIHVKGYTGYVQSENPFKQSIVGHAFLSRSKIAHCKLNDGEVTFHNGEIKIPAKKTIVSTYDYENELDEELAPLMLYLAQKSAYDQMQAASAIKKALDCEGDLEPLLVTNSLAIDLMHKLNLSSDESEEGLDLPLGKTLHKNKFSV